MINFNKKIKQLEKELYKLYSLKANKENFDFQEKVKNSKPINIKSIKVIPEYDDDFWNQDALKGYTASFKRYGKIYRSRKICFTYPEHMKEEALNDIIKQLESDNFKINYSL